MFNFCTLNDLNYIHIPIWVTLMPRTLVNSTINISINIVTANTTGLQKLQHNHLDGALRHAEKAHKKTKRI